MPIPLNVYFFSYSLKLNKGNDLITSEILFLFLYYPKHAFFYFKNNKFPHHNKITYERFIF